MHTGCRGVGALFIDGQPLDGIALTGVGRYPGGLLTTSPSARGATAGRLVDASFIVIDFDDGDLREGQTVRVFEVSPWRPTITRSNLALVV